MEITISELEKIKADYGDFEIFATQMYNLIGHSAIEFDDFCTDLNRLIVDMACGKDGPQHIQERVHYLFSRKIRDRHLLRRNLPDDRIIAYRTFLESVSIEKELELKRKTVRSLISRHAPFLREFVARYPHS